jgi:hypothetical protein
MDIIRPRKNGIEGIENGSALNSAPVTSARAQTIINPVSSLQLEDAS